MIVLVAVFAAGSEELINQDIDGGFVIRQRCQLWALSAPPSPVQHHPGRGEGSAGGEDEDGDEEAGHRLLGLGRLRRGSP